MTNKPTSARTESMRYYKCFMDIDPIYRADFDSSAACKEHLITALPDNVRIENSGSPVPSFLAVTQQEARDHVLIWLPYFKDEEWVESDIMYLHEFYTGWVIRKDRIELQLIEEEIENMELDDMERFLPVLCNHLYECVVRNKVPDRLISYNPEDNL